MTAGTVSHYAPAVLTVSPVTDTVYKRFSASWATTQSVYEYNRVELSFNFAPAPEYASYSLFRFLVYIDSMAFGSQTDWTLLSVAGISREGFPLTASVTALGSNYYLLSIETKSIETLTLIFEHNGSTYTGGYNVGAFTLSFSSAWVDTVPDPAESISSETFPDPEISLPTLETADLSYLEQYFRLDLPAMNLAPYYSAFTWWGTVIDNIYGSLPIFSIMLTVGITVGAFALIGGLYKSDWRRVKADKVEKEREAKAESRYQRRKAENAKRYKRKGGK